jgi:hypothetical protein
MLNDKREFKWMIQMTIQMDDKVVLLESNGNRTLVKEGWLSSTRHGK